MGEDEKGGKVNAIELLHGQIVSMEALVRVLERKGMLAKAEVLEEIKKIREELSKAE